MRLQKIIDILEQSFPLSFAEEWDNSGLLVGRRDAEIRRIFVALDVTDQTLEEACGFGADLMLTHHPLIFTPPKQVTDATFLGRRILTLAEQGMACYAMHTNFDVLAMADLNAAQLRLSNTEVLEVTAAGEDGSPEGLGRIGDLPDTMTPEELAVFVQQQMQTASVRFYGDAGQEIYLDRIAVCGGSGKSVVRAAIEKGAEALVTGDIDYHTAIDACAEGLCILDAGHYGTESGFIPYMVSFLREHVPACETRGAEIVQPYGFAAPGGTVC